MYSQKANKFEIMNLPYRELNTQGNDLMEATYDLKKQ